MKKMMMMAFLFIMITTSHTLKAQDSRSVRAAKMSFKAAEDKFRDRKYSEAAIDYEIVIHTISAENTSRKNLEMRMESLVRLIEIYFNRSSNITKGCEHLDRYFTTMDQIRGIGILRASDLLEYQRLEKRFEADYVPKCQIYKNLDDDMEKFKEKFEQEFE